MGSDQQANSVKRYLPHVVICTAAVTLVPITLVTFLEASGLVSSMVLSLLIGASVSVTLATVGARVWMRFGAHDVVFADLLLWGWLRRLRNERRVARSLDMLGLRGDASSRSAPADRRSRLRVLKDLARALESRDPYTYGHNRRVERHSYMIAKAMGLPESLAEKIRVAASVHDVGKLDIPLAVLRKPARLTDEEFDLVKQHSAKGAEMVASLGDPELTMMVRHHHERLDGSGYPDGLTGDEISVGARVIAAADTFDAIVSNRSYRGAKRHKQAIEIMKNEARTKLDADVVAAFLSYYSGRSSLEWWASVSTLPQRALRVFSAEGASAATVAQNAGAVTAAVLLGAAAVVPLTPDLARAEAVASPGRQTNSAHTLAAGESGAAGLADSLGAAGGGREVGKRFGRDGHDLDAVLLAAGEDIGVMNDSDAGAAGAGNSVAGGQAISTPPGQGGTPPGKSDANPPGRDRPPGRSGEPPGKGQGNGQSDNAPGQSNGQADNAPGQGEGQGQADDAPGQGQADDAPGQAQSANSSGQLGGQSGGQAGGKSSGKGNGGGQGKGGGRR